MSFLPVGLISAITASQSKSVTASSCPVGLVNYNTMYYSLLGNWMAYENGGTPSAGTETQSRVNQAKGRGEAFAEYNFWIWTYNQ